MYSQKVSKSKDNIEVVHFSINQTFYCNGILFKIFKTGSTNPKAPQLAILNVEKKERISGLFKIGSSLYQGDTKPDTGKKQYFRLRFIDQNTVELTNFNEALSSIGVITTLDGIDPFTGHHSPSNEAIGVGIESKERGQVSA